MVSFFVVTVMVPLSVEFQPANSGLCRRAGSPHAKAKNRGVPRRRRRESVTDSGQRNSAV